MSYIRLNYLAAFVLGVLSVPVASAQSVVFSGSNNTATGLPYTIPLQVGSQVTVAPNGDVRLNCQLESGTSRCVGFPSGGNSQPGNAPTVSLTSSAGASVQVGTAFNINTTLGNNPESCLRSSSPTVAGWDGSVIPGLASGTIALAAAVPHTLSLKCFNDAGSGSGSVVVTGTGTDGGGGGVPTACTGAAAPPAGYTRDTLQQLANLPISSQAKAFKFISSKYLAMAFKGDNQFPNSSGINLAGGTVGGATLRYSAFYLSISECQGDFRLPVNAASTNDPTLTGACRMYVGTPEGTFMQIKFNSGSPSNVQCNLDPTKNYFVNIVLDDPSDGLSTSSPDECITTACGNGLSIQ